MWTLTTDCGLWQDQRDTIRSQCQDHSDYMCGLCQPTVGSKMSRGIEFQQLHKIMATICGDFDSWWQALKRSGRGWEKPPSQSPQPSVWILTADSGLRWGQGDSMWSRWQDLGNYVKWQQVTQCRKMAILYNWLATRPRSLAMIIPIHLYLLSLISTFATISYNYRRYADKAKPWHICHYTIMAVQVNIYISLMGFCEYTPFPPHVFMK